MIPWNLVKHRHVCFKLPKSPHKITTQNHHIITIWLFLKSQFLLVNSTPISASWPAWASSALGFRPSAPLSAWRDEWDIRRFIYWLDTWLMQMPPCFCWCVLDFLTGLSYLCYSLGELLFIFWVLVKCHYILDLLKKIYTYRYKTMYFTSTCVYLVYL